MSGVMPQTAVDRIFAFMAMEKYGRIELDFQAGRLMSVKVVEHFRVGPDDQLTPVPLDRDLPPPQDSET